MYAIRSYYADEPDASLFEQAFKQIKGSFDLQYGGFEPAPKFPTPHRMLFLLRYYHRHEDPKVLDMVQKTLIAMRLGGSYNFV